MGLVWFQLLKFLGKNEASFVLQHLEPAPPGWVCQPLSAPRSFPCSPSLSNLTICHAAPTACFLCSGTWLLLLLLFKSIYLIYLFLAALGLRCCAQAFSSCGEQGLLFVVVLGLLIVVASLVAEHGL